MASRSDRPPVETANALVGWQGIRFTVPPDWNVTGFSTDPGDGYLKVDSSGTMFVQIKWTDPGFRKARSAGEWLWNRWKLWRGKTDRGPTEAPDLRGTLDNFLKETARRARKSKTTFDSKVKARAVEAGGLRTSHNFSWTGGGQGQGKIWWCAECRRVVIAQVVGQGRDPVADVASMMFSTFSDHAVDGWQTWALYDLVAGAPAEYRLRSHKLMSGYLKLELEKPGGERIVIERWGLANITRKKFTIREWFAQACGAEGFRSVYEDAEVAGHAGVRGAGRVINPIAWGRALFSALTTFRPATHYEGCAWECVETNKIYAVQVWRNVRTEGLLEEVVARCECH